LESPHLGVGLERAAEGQLKGRRPDRRHSFKVYPMQSDEGG